MPGDKFSRTHISTTTGHADHPSATAARPRSDRKSAAVPRILHPRRDTSHCAARVRCPPMRMFLIDADGKIAFAGKKGPFGWDDEAFEEAVKAVTA